MLWANDPRNVIQKRFVMGDSSGQLARKKIEARGKPGSKACGRSAGAPVGRQYQRVYANLIGKPNRSSEYAGLHAHLEGCKLLKQKRGRGEYNPRVTARV